MSATDTALKLIEWAICSYETSEVPPWGDLSAAEQLAYPSEELLKAMRQLTVVTSARLRWHVTPLEDNYISTENILIAAGLGSANANPKLARTLLKAVTKETSYAGDWILRYGLITPTLPFLQNEIVEDCLELSPLTTVFHHPIPGQETAAVNFVSKILDSPLAKASLILHLAQPTTDIRIRDWRSELLERLRLGNQKEQSFVIDVYEATMIYHQEEILNQTKDAYAVITNPQAASNEAILRDALSTANWWQPLWFIERDNLDRLRQRRYLSYAYREGIKLFNLSRKMLGK